MHKETLLYYLTTQERRYDTDTGLYYLQSRYYNADWGRFINTDDTTVLQMAQGQLLSANLFAYCLNNPVMGSDSDGFFAMRTNDVSGIINCIVSIIGAGATLNVLFKALRNGKLTSVGHSMMMKLFKIVSEKLVSEWV